MKLKEYMNMVRDGEEISMLDEISRKECCLDKDNDLERAETWINHLYGLLEIKEISSSHITVNLTEVIDQRLGKLLPAGSYGVEEVVDALISMLSGGWPNRKIDCLFKAMCIATGRELPKTTLAFMESFVNMLDEDSETK